MREYFLFFKYFYTKNVYHYDFFDLNSLFFDYL